MLGRIHSETNSFSFLPFLLRCFRVASGFLLGSRSRLNTRLCLYENIILDSSFDIAGFA